MRLDVALGIGAAAIGDGADKAKPRHVLMSLSETKLSRLVVSDFREQFLDLSQLVLRLSGATAAVKSAFERLSGELIAPAAADPFWAGLRDHQDEFFIGAARAALDRTIKPFPCRGESVGAPCL